MRDPRHNDQRGGRGRPHFESEAARLAHLASLRARAEDTDDLDERAARERHTYWMGQKGFIEDRLLDQCIAMNNARIRPTVTKEIMRRWTIEFLCTLAAENWEQLLEIPRKVFLECEGTRGESVPRAELMDRPLTMTNITAKTLAHLTKAGIITVADLIQLSRERLLDIPQIGPNSLKECCDALREMGFTSEDGAMEL